MAFLADASLAVGCALQSIDELRYVEENSLGNMDKEGKYCDKTERKDEDNPALYFANENISSFCCSKGKVILDPLQPVPEFRNNIVQVETLYEYHDDFGNRIVQVITRDEYLEKIRQLNISFAFISMNVKLEKPPGKGVFVFRIHGQIQHLIGSSVLQPNNKTPKYASLYFIEPKQALAARVNESTNEKIFKALFESLQSFIIRVSPYAKAFKHLYEVEQQQKFVFYFIF